jgi:hypothetical protein
MLARTQAVTIYLLFAGTALAQNQQRPVHALADSSVGRIIANARVAPEDGFGADWLRDILRQRGKPQPQAKLDAIADSLTAEVLRQDAVPRDPTDARAALAVLKPLSTLRSVGRGGEPDSGTPYSGSLDRLIRIYREAAPASTIRALVLNYFLCYDFAPGLAVLREAALSAEYRAIGAMELMTNAAIHGTCDITAAQRRLVLDSLREAFQRNLAQNREAGQLLNGFAWSQGWTRS